MGYFLRADGHDKLTACQSSAQPFGPMMVPVRVSMRKLLACLFLLVLPLACGGGKHSSDDSAPVISNLTLSPDHANEGDGGSFTYAQLGFDFQDPDGDIVTLRMTSGGSTRDFALSGMNNRQSGSIQGTIQLSTATVGTFPFQIQVVDGKGHLSNQLSGSFRVDPIPKVGLTSLVPASTHAGGSGFTLTVNGSLFTLGNTVYWNGTSLPTNFVSSTQLTATVSADAILAVGTAAITVVDPLGSEATSDPLTFTILPAEFGVNRISPNSVNVGGKDFLMSVNGSQFAPTATVCWNGVPRPTTFVSSTNLTALIGASDIASVGHVLVTVTNPSDQGGTSNPIILTITPPDAVAFQINPGHSGAVTFPSATLPATSTWSVTLDGPPSYALIMEGKVVVTLPISGGSEIIALDQATGAKVWGPVVLSGSASATYDQGQVFVSQCSTSSGILQALDAATGNPKWSAMIGGYGGYGAPPTAANGFVYASTWSGTITAFDQSTGAIAWNSYASSCSPAVTSDGVYLTYTDMAEMLDSATGAAIWTAPQGGSGGGGATPVVANGLLFAPDGFAFYDGQVLDARTGALKGTYAASVPPAIGPELGFFLQSGTLRGIRLSNNTIVWSFAGDGNLVTSPILVNDVVFVGSSSGTLYALDAATGTPVWSQTLPGAIPSGPSWSTNRPYSGLSAGDGLLVVPAGNTLTAFTLCPN
jgi:outer membrane protein assembly factor BamB